MTLEDRSNRRAFLRQLLTTVEAGAVAAAFPWGMRSAAAAAPGRALIGFQVLPSWMHLLATILAEMRGHYDVDLGVKAVVVPGGAGVHALELVHQAPRDGTTVLISPSTVLTMTPAVRTMPASPADDLLPVAAIGEIPFGFIVGPAVPAQVRTVSAYFAWVRSNPASNSYGVPGLGTAPHFVGSEMSRIAELPMRAVGYRGSAALAEDVAAGNVPAGLTVILGAEDSARYPQLRLLAVAGNHRLRHLPDTPTLRESGCAESFPGETLGFFVERGTPEPKVQQLIAAVATAAQTSAVIQAMTDAVIIPMEGTARPYAETIVAERALWRTLIAQHDFNVQG